MKIFLKTISKLEILKKESDSPRDFYMIKSLFGILNSKEIKDDLYGFGDMGETCGDESVEA